MLQQSEVRGGEKNSSRDEFLQGGIRSPRKAGSEGIAAGEEVRVGSGVLKVQGAFWDKLKGSCRRPLGLTSAEFECNPAAGWRARDHYEDLRGCRRRRVWTPGN